MNGPHSLEHWTSHSSGCSPVYKPDQILSLFTSWLIVHLIDNSSIMNKLAILLSLVALTIAQVSYRVSLRRVF